MAVNVIGSIAEFKEDVVGVDVDVGGDLVFEEESGGFFGLPAGDFAGLEVVSKVSTDVVINVRSFGCMSERERD